MNERQVRSIVQERAEGCCERCGQWGGLTLHHRRKKSQSKGGGWSIPNCVMVHGSGTTGCHGWIESNPDAAEIEGFHCRPWQDPAAIPVLYRGSMAFLTDDGRVEYVD